MAQYDDPFNAASGSPERLNGSGANGAPSSHRPGPFRPFPVEGDRPDVGPGPGSASPAVRPENPRAASWLLRPSSPMSRQRNQWRQFKQMKPDFGLAAPESPPESAPALPRQTALPRFPAKAGSGPASAPRANPRPLAKGPTPEPPLQVHPHSSAAAPFPRTAATPRGSKVTPLRSRPARTETQAATLAPQHLASSTALAPAPASANRLRENRPRFRTSFGRRRLAKPPLPVLYLIRLMILGVGVAAIAGTLLSVLSPNHLASTSGGGTAGSSAMPTPSSPRSRLVGPGATSVASLQPTSELTRLKAQLEQLATLTPGLTPVLYALDLDSGRYVDMEGSKVVAAASTIKVPILVAFLHQVDAGAIALNQALVLQEQQLAGGSGSMANDAPGSEYTALEVATRMIIHSDNTATNMMIDALGGQEALNQLFAAWGLESTVLRSPLPDLEGTNTTSARDLALLMGLLDQGELLSPRSRDRLFSIMQRTVNRSMIPFSLTDGSIVANKTGDIAMALGDVALVDTPNGQRYVLAILVQRPNNDGRASELIRRLTETTHAEMNQPLAPVGRPPSPGSPDGSTSYPAPPGEAGVSPAQPGEPVPEGSGVAPGGSLETPPASSPPATAPGDQVPPG
ncbi:MAG TPA: serine hydrolase [Leptolyngbyaceae cyanobacterium M65_K2018_010]|nr:serine hydrolase [Leptolyngbyaceae cyanobacterium M65_K2018_010]